MESFIGIYVFLVTYGYILGCSGATGARILCTAVQQPSHVNEVIGASEKLLNYGHEVYIAVSNLYPNTEKFEKRGFKVIRYSMPDDLVINAMSQYEDMLAEEVLKGTEALEIDNKIQGPNAYRDCVYMMTDKQFIEEVRKLNFGFAVVDGFFITPCTAVLPVYLNIPFATVSSTFHPIMARVPSFPSFVFCNIGEMSDRMDFWEKWTNILLTWGTMYPPVSVRHNNSLLEEFAPQFLSWDGLMLQAQLFINTRDHILEWPRPSLPNVLYVPGLSSYTGLSQLPPDLQELMDRSKNGVIIMSFGSMFAKLPDDIVARFLNAFSQLNQTVIWRLNLQEGHPHTIPKNVHILSWLPQQELLSHNNTLVFITHCGNGGQYESVYHAVPMLGFPLFAEQHHNAYRMEYHNIGIRLNIMDFTTEDVIVNLKRLMSEPTFKNNINKRSDILKDTPLSAQETTAFWINHVVKFGGDHLRSSALDMMWWQYYMLDMLLLGFIILTALLFLTYIAIKLFKKIAGV